MTTHTFTDALAKNYTLEINDATGDIAIQGSSSRLTFFTRPEDRPAIAAAIHAPEPMFKANATFDDIQKGDTIRWSYEAGDLKFTREGIADNSDANSWYTSAGTLVASGPGQYPVNPTLHILSRPTPQLPTQPGAAIWIMEGQSGSNVVTNKAAILDSDLSWVSSNEDGNTVWLDPEHITTWEPLNHVTTRP